MKKIFLLLAVLVSSFISLESQAQTQEQPSLYPCFLLGDLQDSPFAPEVCSLLDRQITTAFSASIYETETTLTLEEALSLIFKAAGRYQLASTYVGVCENPLISYAKYKNIIKSNTCNPPDASVLRSSFLVLATRMWLATHYADYTQTRDSYNGPDLGTATVPYGIAKDYFKFGFMKGALYGVLEATSDGDTSDLTYGNVYLSRSEAAYMIAKIFGIPGRSAAYVPPADANGETTPVISGLPDPNEPPPTPVEETPPTPEPTPVTPENFTWRNVTDIQDHPLENHIVDLIESGLTDVTASQPTFRPDEPQTLNDSIAMLTKKYGVYERASTFSGACGTEPLMSYAMAAAIIKTAACPAGSAATTRSGLIVMDYRFMNKYKLAEYKAIIASYDGPTFPANLYTPYGIPTDAFKLAYMKGALVDLDINNRSQTDYNYGRGTITRGQGASILDGLLDLPKIVIETAPPPPPPPPPAPVEYPWLMDENFGNAGILSVNHFTNLTAVDGEGRIVLVEGNSGDGEVYVRRLLANGLPDQTFATATNGIAKLNLPENQTPSVVTIDSQNRIVIAGTTPDSEGYRDIFVARFTQYGELDRSFAYFNMFNYFEIFGYTVTGSNITGSGALRMQDYPKAILVDDSNGNILVTATSNDATQAYNRETISTSVYCYQDDGRPCSMSRWEGGGYINRAEISTSGYTATIVSKIVKDPDTGDYVLLGNVRETVGAIYHPFISIVHPNGRVLSQPFVYDQSNASAFLVALGPNNGVFVTRSLRDNGYYAETTHYTDFYNLDTQFGNAGIQKYLLAPDNESANTSQIVVDDEGGLFVGGSFRNGYYVSSIIALIFADITPNGDAYILHLRPNGQPDSLFGAQGKVTIDETDSDYIRSLTLSDSGTVLAHFSANQPVGPSLIKFSQAQP